MELSHVQAPSLRESSTADGNAKARSGKHDQHNGEVDAHNDGDD